MELTLRTLEDWLSTGGGLPRACAAATLSILAEYRLLRAVAETAEDLASPEDYAAASVRFDDAMGAWRKWKGKASA
jgi:hypothetical protein